VRQHAQFGALSVEKVLGALPVVAGLCSRLKIRDIIDEACPVRDVAGLTHGQVIEALVANRLTSPAPLCMSRLGRGTGRSVKHLASSLSCSTMIGSGVL
jgi:hypothetical protein